MDPDEPLPEFPKDVADELARVCEALALEDQRAGDAIATWLRDAPDAAGADIARLRKALAFLDQRLGEQIASARSDAERQFSALTRMTLHQLLTNLQTSPRAMATLRALLWKQAYARSDAQRDLSAKGGQARWQQDYLHAAAIEFLDGLTSTGEWRASSYKQTSRNLRGHLEKLSGAEIDPRRFGSQWVAGYFHSRGLYKQPRR